MRFPIAAVQRIITRAIGNCGYTNPCELNNLALPAFAGFVCLDVFLNAEVVTSSDLGIIQLTVLVK